MLEAGGRVGGVIDTVRSDDLVIDCGADMFTSKPPAAIELCRRLGVEDRLIEPKREGRGAKIVCRGRPQPIPEGFVLMRPTRLRSMMTTPLLSPSGKLRLLCEPLVPRRRSEQDESVGSFVRRRLGREVLERIVAPLVAGIYTADVERLSMRATMAPFVEMERAHGSLFRATRARRKTGEDTVERLSSGARYSQFRAFRGGMLELIESLSSALPRDAIRTRCRVDSVRRDDSKWDVAMGDGRRETFDHLVIATPPSEAARLVGEIAPLAAHELASIESASAAIAVLVVRRSDIRRPAGTFGFVVPPVEGRQILAASFASEKFAGRAPDERVIIRVFLGGALQPELLRRDDDELLGIARGELSDLIGLDGRPVWSRVVRWNRAMPQYHVGHLEKVERIRESVRDVEGLSLVGNAFSGVGIAPVIAAAERVARQIADRAASTQPIS